SEEPRVKAAYIEQVRCVNRKLAHVVEVLLEKTDGEAIIVIQSDHGFGRFGKGPWKYEMDQVVERSQIFAAYHLPGAPSNLIYASITPVNAFRAILRHYYRLPLPRIEDRTYWATQQRPYRLFELGPSGTH